MKVPILLPNIFNHPFTYESNLNLKVGDYVVVPFGKSKITGVVWDEFEKKNNRNFKVKNVLKKLDVTPLKKTTIKFLNWFSEYNIIPKGMSLKLVLLSSNAIEKFSKDTYKNFDFTIKDNSIKLSEEQKKSLKKMNISNQKFRVHVLQGTTGSGKTMVYFEALKEIINKGLQGLILLPEIGLTGQFEKKFLEVVICVTKTGNTLILERNTGKSLFDINFKNIPSSNIPDQEIWQQINLTKPNNVSPVEYNYDSFSKLNSEKKYKITKKLKDVKLGWFEPPKFGEKIVFLKDGYKSWEGTKEQIFNTDNESVTNFVYSSDLFKKVREVYLKDEIGLEENKGADTGNTST